MLVVIGLVTDTRRLEHGHEMWLTFEIYCKGAPTDKLTPGRATIQAFFVQF